MENSEMNIVLSFDEIAEMFGTDANLEDITLEDFELTENEIKELNEASDEPKSNGLGAAIGSIKYLMADSQVGLTFKLIGASKAIKKAEGDKKQQAFKERAKVIAEIRAAAAKGREKYKKLDPKKKADLDKKAEQMKKKLEGIKIK